MTTAGLAVRQASATKNALAAVMNVTAVLVFAFSPSVRWLEAAVVCVGALAGGLFGAWALKRVPERPLRLGIVAVGLLLTIGLFLRHA